MKKLRKRICIICNKKFSTYHHRRIMCSNECQYKRNLLLGKINHKKYKNNPNKKIVLHRNEIPIAIIKELEIPFYLKRRQSEEEGKLSFLNQKWQNIIKEHH